MSSVTAHLKLSLHVNSISDYRSCVFETSRCNNISEAEILLSITGIAKVSTSRYNSTRELQVLLVENSTRWAQLEHTLSKDILLRV